MRSLWLVVSPLWLALASQAPAQERSAAVPPELREPWAGFVAAWAGADASTLPSRLTSDFVLGLLSGAHPGAASSEQWLRLQAGGLDAPTAFLREPERILETGLTRRPRYSSPRPRGWEEEMCDPEGADASGVEVVPYRREWVRSPSGVWQVRSIVLH
jgi:hypothetical protein